MTVTVRAKHRSRNVQAVLEQLPTDECVAWPGYIDKAGYGVIASEVTHRAHRYVWILLHGIPELPELDHLCRNTACCNPAHLEPVTSAENLRRRDAARTHCRNGHEYTPDNVYRYHGHRMCRTCRRAVDRQRPSENRSVGVCSVDGCSRPNLARLFCSVHYRRWQKHGDPLAGSPAPVHRNLTHCVIDGCDRSPIAHGWCGTHYWRWRTHGDPLMLKGGVAS